MHKKKRRQRRDIKENKTFTLLSDEKVSFFSGFRLISKDEASFSGQICE